MTLILTGIFWTFIIVTQLSFFEHRFVPKWMTRYNKWFLDKLPFQEKKIRKRNNIISYVVFGTCFALYIFLLANKEKYGVPGWLTSLLWDFGYGAFFFQIYLYGASIRSLTSRLHTAIIDSYSTNRANVISFKKEITSLNLSPKYYKLYEEMKVDNSRIPNYTVEVIECDWLTGYNVEQNTVEFKQRIRGEKLDDILKDFNI